MLESCLIANFLLTTNGPRRVVTCTTGSPTVTTGSYSFEVWEQVRNNTFPVPWIIRLTWESCWAPVILEGNVGGNHLWDGSVCPSPQNPSTTNDLPVDIETSLRQSFPWLLPCSGIIHILSGPDTCAPLSTVKITGGCRCMRAYVYVCVCGKTLKNQRNNPNNVPSSSSLKSQTCRLRLRWKVTRAVCGKRDRRWKQHGMWIVRCVNTHR